MFSQSILLKLNQILFASGANSGRIGFVKWKWLCIKHEKVTELRLAIVSPDCTKPGKWRFSWFNYRASHIYESSTGPVELGGIVACGHINLRSRKVDLGKLLRALKNGFIQEDYTIGQIEIH